LLSGESTQFADSDLRIILDGDGFGLLQRQRGAWTGGCRIRRRSWRRGRLCMNGKWEKGDR
jgi:hypothetical protein